MILQEETIPSGAFHLTYPRVTGNRNVWSAALSQAKNEGDRLVYANVFGLCWSTTPGLDGMRCALVLKLLSLPGATAAEADRVIVGRPYNEPGEVVTRRIMPKTEVMTKFQIGLPLRNDFQTIVGTGLFRSAKPPSLSRRDSSRLAELRYTPTRTSNEQESYFLQPIQFVVLASAE